jgi:uncharacterized 2Fe-2S/4Fe-4S cluster protein (DUF4445 family)
MGHKKFFQIEFQPLGLRDRFLQGQSLLDCIRQKEIDLVSLCGGEGTCAKCRVQIVKGRVSEPLQEERENLSKKELADGYRLACKTYPKSDLVLNIPAESLSAPQRLQLEGQEISVLLDPCVRAYPVSVTAPSLTDLRGDDQRLLDALQQQHGVSCNKLDESVLRALSPFLRSSDWKASVAIQNAEIISVTPLESRNLGVAVDLGTTKIAAYLVDLKTGRTLSAKGIMNPQIAYGEDVIARMVHAQRSEEGAHTLQKKVVESLNELFEALLRDTGINKTHEINEVVIAGNTAMHHLLLGLPVSQLVRAPYVPAVSGAMDLKGRQLGLSMARGAFVHFPPNIAGFVGGDHLAMLLSVRVEENPGPMLAMDIGTNTEISLVNQGLIHSVSCASGPAFEGGHISCGMRAGKGAIDHVRISDNRLQYHVIQEAIPVGICGSGIFDTVAQLFSHGLMDKSGRIKGDHPLVREGQNGREVILVHEREVGGKAIAITQKDVRELQLAMGAIRAGIDILLKETGLLPAAINEFMVAGAFGSYLDISSAVCIGMLPKIPLDRFRQVGNAAGMGAKTMLLSKAKRKKIQRLAREIRYVELAGNADFHRFFMKAMVFEGR